MILNGIITIGKNAEIQQLARQVCKEIFAADDLNETIDLAKRVDPDLIIFDHYLGPDYIRDFIRANDDCTDVHTLVVGDGDNSIHSPAQFIEMGAHYYLHDKQDHHKLREIATQIKNTLETPASNAGKDDFFANELAAAVSMVGKSQATLHTLKMIKLVSSSQCNPVLVVGETGTGKELVAKAIHTQRSPNEPFVAVNCAALSANLLESELFGHVKGSFTSADREKTGLLELAGNGAIFLDEISEMPIDLQAKLLRVLQEKTFRKVGGIKEIACNATIIASSNRNLINEVQANRFRRDLYYRLNIFPITISPLISPDRKNDIPLLTKYFLKTSMICPGKTNKITSATKLAIESLQDHNWPGNVRELRNTIERAILLETTNKIGLSSIVINPEHSNQFSDNTRANKIKDFSLVKAERELIAHALKETNWQKTKAAQMLGISRATLYAKVKQHSIESDLSALETQGEIATPPFAEPLTV